MAALPLIVTRPAPDNQRWVHALQALGHRAEGLPLMDIGPSRSPQAQAALQAALADMAHNTACYRALMFVSANAVRYFFTHPLVQAAAVTPATLAARCWSPGPGTTQALREAGVADAQIDAPAADAAQFESETLWAVVAPQVRHGDCVLIVRGADGLNNPEPAQGTGRAWLATQLQARGARAVFAPVYERHAPAATPAWQDRLHQLHVQSAYWLFSSSECLQHLAALAPALTWQAHTALATHPRIAQQAQALGFGRVLTTRPALDDIHRFIQSQS
ncbi:Uncharacterised protein [uncultured Comamonas sp.]|nr:Uncharacterised protein [uncultured Comamonas sp.]